MDASVRAFSSAAGKEFSAENDAEFPYYSRVGGIEPDSSEMRTKVSNRAPENVSERTFSAVADNEQSADCEAITLEKIWVGGIERAEAKQVDIQQNGDAACVGKCDHRSI